MLQFYGCNKGVDPSGNPLDSDDWCHEFNVKIHQVFFIISIVFLIITLFVYLAEDSFRCIRKKKLNKKILNMVSEVQMSFS